MIGSRILTKTGKEFNRVTLTFNNWYKNPTSDRFLERLQAGEDIKIVYDEPWFWKVSLYRKPIVSHKSIPRIEFAEITSTAPEFAPQTFIPITKALPIAPALPITKALPIAQVLQVNKPQQIQSQDSAFSTPKKQKREKTEMSKYKTPEKKTPPQLKRLPVKKLKYNSNKPKPLNLDLEKETHNNGRV